MTLMTPAPDDKAAPIVIIYIYADATTSHDQVLGVLAHELGGFFGEATVQMQRAAASLIRRHMHFISETI
jgi:hypothetical protein